MSMCLWLGLYGMYCIGQVMGKRQLISSLASLQTVRGAPYSCIWR